MKQNDSDQIKRDGHRAMDVLLSNTWIKSDKTATNLRGIGISILQILSVLITASFEPSDSTVILKKPEVHLHSLAQFVLAEYLVVPS